MMQIFVKLQIYKTMKKLLNNYTTPEQSKRLLELGVPADSADCVAHIIDNSIDLYEGSFPNILKGDVRITVINERHTYTKATTLKDGECWIDEPYPCWSVGRLMEIFDICCAISYYNDWCNTQCVPNEYVAYIIGCYERAIDSKTLDFSKLEAV